MRPALHRAAKTGTPRRRSERPRSAARSGAHASRWAVDELAPRAPRRPRLRAERHARRSPLGGGSRVGPLCLYGYDAHGNVTFLSDTEGAVIATYEYDAWGDLITAGSDIQNSRLYVGEEDDRDLGLFNLRARYYRAAFGRFVSRDSVDIADRRPRELDDHQAAGSVNQLMARNITASARVFQSDRLTSYSYAGADPILRRDPRGTTEGLEEVLSFAEGLAEVADIGFGFNLPNAVLHYDPVDKYLDLVKDSEGDDSQLYKFVSQLNIRGAAGIGLIVSCQIALSTLDGDVPSYLTAMGCVAE